VVIGTVSAGRVPEGITPVPSPVGSADAVGESMAPVGSVLGVSVGAGVVSDGDGSGLVALRLGRSVGRRLGLTGAEQAASASATDASSAPVPIVRAPMTILSSRPSRVDVVGRRHPS
jgi:hypothetical protein